jgi:anthranilate phosphoribosyltransferase
MIKDAIRLMSDGTSLTLEGAELAMREIMNGEATPSQIAALLMGLRIKGESVEELTGFAKVMREKATRIPHRQPNVVDTCGTGGDHSGTLNISTTAAFVAAGAGAPVAKHGNRAASSQCGSADVLAALGVKLDLTPEQVGACIDDVGIGFLFAPALHAAMKYAMPTRKEMGIRTAFNLLGPLTNPAGAQSQLLGVFDGDFVEKLAGALRALGAKHALVVHGEDGLDEITTTDETRVAELKDGRIKVFHLDPLAFFKDTAKADDLAGGDAAQNALITRAVLQGEAGPKRDIVLINAAAALVAADLAATLKEGLDLAAKSLDSGVALAKLEALVKKSNSFN